MLHACAAKFDVTENLKNFAKFFGNSPQNSKTFQDSPLNQIVCTCMEP